MANENLKKDWHEKVLPLVKTGRNHQGPSNHQEKNTKGEENKEFKFLKALFCSSWWCRQKRYHHRQKSCFPEELESRGFSYLVSAIAKIDF